MKKSGVPARAAQIDRGEFLEFIVRIPKKDELRKAQ
jgi:ParB family chromosome partitioning protein